MSRPPVARVTAPLGALLLLGACRGELYQSALAAKGPQAERVEGLFWFAFWVSAAVWVLTVGAMLWAAWRARARERRGEVLAQAESERGMTRGVAAGVGVTVVILLAFFFYDLAVGRAYTRRPPGDPVVIELVGHQWWWEAVYADTGVQNRFTTANELHVPVGRPVVLEMSARDVIHSVWVPNLAGKRDLIPGYTTSVWFQADTPGVYRGQCAEFCGQQHAKMGLVVIAEPPARFAQWVAAQRKPAPSPTSLEAARGQKVFLSGSCAVCHRIGGTTAGATNGPDLTHLASRYTIAAATLPNTRGNLGGWIVDPQSVKPGTHMPPNILPPKDLEALLTYLQSLK